MYALIRKNQLVNVVGAAAIMSLVACNADQAPRAENPNIATAKQWVTAGATGKRELMATAEALMAEDGMMYRKRYVGFGFTWDPTEEGGRMIVGTVSPGSPAAAVLEPNDEFISVRGVEVNEENIGKLDFRGKPDEVVDAVILRNGEEIEISVARGIIESAIDKTSMLQWLDGGDADTWAPDKWKLHEAVGDGNVVYVWTQSWDTDENTGLPVDEQSVTRFHFNDAGKVIAIANLSEDRFALEQSGWTISR
jgi:hypothetical protein